MTRTAKQHMPLASAYLCQDCDAVGNNSMVCPACASRALMGLAGVLGRRKETVIAKVLQFPTMAA
jgi:hypothetical protein